MMCGCCHMRSHAVIPTPAIPTPVIPTPAKDTLSFFPRSIGLGLGLEYSYVVGIAGVGITVCHRHMQSQDWIISSVKLSVMLFCLHSPGGSTCIWCTAFANDSALLHKDTYDLSYHVIHMHLKIFTEWSGTVRIFLICCFVGLYCILTPVRYTKSMWKSKHDTDVK